MSKQLVIDWAYLAPLEQTIKGAEGTGLRARWDFGCYLRDQVPREVGGRGRIGPLQGIAAELNVSEQELRFRRQFAEQYPTEEKLANALASFDSWYAVISRGLIREPKAPIEPPPLPEGEWHTIVADPPWRVNAGPGWASGGVTRPLEYPTLSTEEIAALSVPAAENAHLYLWTINAYIEDAYEIARAWGFNPSTLLVWAKAPHGMGLGGTYVLTTEYIVFATRGSLASKQRVDTSWFQWQRGGHSVKPDAFYELVASVSPGPYLDLFARTDREGWVVWGNEVAA